MTTLIDLLTCLAATAGYFAFVCLATIALVLRMMNEEGPEKRAEP